MDKYPKRLIEVDLPIRRISEHARREKNIRRGHISTLHIWWARRPLAACRAVICASLWPDPADPLCPSSFRDKAKELMKRWARDHLDILGPESVKNFVAIQKNPSKLNNNKELRRTLLDFIADFSSWDNSTRKEYLETSKILTERAHHALGGVSGTKPLVVDPMAGGGAMPLEALRVGADCFASDINPVAFLLNKVVLEYAPRYGQRLVNELRKWGKWIKKEARQELGRFYPNDPDGSTPIGYLWARTICCEGPGCGATVPIVKSQLLSSRKGSEAAISIEYEDGTLITNVIIGASATKVNGGTSRRSSVTCPACGFTMARKRVEVQAKEKGFGFHMLAVCLRRPDGSRKYRQSTDKDLTLLDSADKLLAKWSDKEFGGIPAIPIEELPYLRSIFNVRVYSIDQWYKLFHRRQLLSALTFTSILRGAATKIKRQNADPTFAAAIIECLALSVSNSFQYQCSIATYLTEGIKSAFIQGQSLPMKMDFIEANPLLEGLAGGYDYSMSKHLSGLEYCASFPYTEGTAQNLSALSEILPEDSVDVIATDPPYYDAVPYADCSDFFYIWLRRMLHGVTEFPTTQELTHKEEEIVQLAERNVRYRMKTKDWFEDKMSEALAILRMSAKPSSVAIIVFAHKDTAAWEALLQSVLKAGWVVTGSWPIDTENITRLRANRSAVLGSSIHLICRPRHSSESSVHTEEIGDWRDVLQELPLRIHAWLPRLSEEGIVGADAIFACLGPALEIYSRYSSVEKASGKKVELKEYLEQVWAAVSREALKMIFEGADASGFEEDARLTAMWLWTLRTSIDNGEERENANGKTKSVVGYDLEYDAARKIAQGIGAHFESLGHLVEIKGETSTLLSAGARTHYLFGKDAGEAPRTRDKKKSKQMQFDFEDELNRMEEESGDWTGDLSGRAGSTVLDQLHQSMILFGAGRGEALRRFLVEDGVGGNPLYWRLAQALSALYPSGTDEKRWVDGVLARKKGLGF